MSQELKSFVINLKSLDQAIESPVLAGAGGANGYSLKVVVSQQAACRLTENTKLYLNWQHQVNGVKGYNVFSRTSTDPTIFELNWPNAMLREGTVLCRLEMVDEVSVSPSTNFSVHVLQNPNDGSDFVVSNDYSDFQQAVIDLTTVKDEVLDELAYQKKVSDNITDDAKAAIKATEDAITQIQFDYQEAISTVMKAGSNIDGDYLVPEDDLNNISRACTRMSSGSSVTSAISNTPSGVANRFVVYTVATDRDLSQLGQVLMELNSDNIRLFTRTNTENSWAPWKEVASLSDIPNDMTNEVKTIRDFVNLYSVVDGTHYLEYADTSWVEQTFLDWSGALQQVPNQTYCVTDLIPCWPGQEIKYQSEGIYDNITPVAFYDADGNYLSRVNPVDYEEVGDHDQHVQGTIEVPTNTRYLRFCSAWVYPSGYKNPDTTHGQNHTWYLGLPRGVNEIASDIAAISVKATSSPKYIEDEFDDVTSEYIAHTGYYLDKNGGWAVLSDDNVSVVVEPMSLEEADGLFVTSSSQFATYHMVLTDANGMVLASYNGEDTSVPDIWIRHEIDATTIKAKFPRATTVLLGTYLSKNLKLERHRSITMQEKIQEIGASISDTEFNIPVEVEEITGELSVGYLGKIGGIGNTDDYRHTGFFDISAYDTLTANVSYGWAAVDYCLYDVNEQFLAYGHDDSSGITKQITIATADIVAAYPAARYIKFSGVTKGNTRLRVYSTAKSKNITTGLTSIIAASNVLFGKKIAFCGDSFTAASNLGDDYYDAYRLCYRSYGQRIAERNAMKLYHDGVSGSTMHVVDSESPDTRKPFAYQRYKDVPLDCDYIILQFGLNESGLADNASTLGARDSTDVTTMWGSWNTVLGYLIENHPIARIGVIMSDAWMPQSYFTALKEICEWWGVPLLDLGGDPNVPLMNGGRRSGSGLTLNPVVAALRNKTFYQNYDTNDSHPNDAGHEWRSTVIENWIRSL